MMHGRGGAYSTAAKGRYDAATISQRHRMWGDLWAANGYVAVLVDGFGPRGYPAGFPRFSYDDAARRGERGHGAAARRLWRARLAAQRAATSTADRIGLQGWSNGGSAALATMAAGTGFAPTSLKGFTRRAGVLSGLRSARPLRRRLSPLCAGAGVSWHRRRGSVVSTLPRAGRAQRKDGGDIDDHDLSRRDARLRRSRPRAAGEPRQCESESRRDGAAQRFFAEQLAASHPRSEARSFGGHGLLPSPRCGRGRGVRGPSSR